MQANLYRRTYWRMCGWTDKSVSVYMLEGTICNCARFLLFLSSLRNFLLESELFFISYFISSYLPFFFLLPRAETSLIVGRGEANDVCRFGGLGAFVG